MVAAVKHNPFVQSLARKLIDLNADTIKLALCTTTPAAIDVYASLSMEVANGQGYTSGGIALTGQSAVQASGVLTFDATDPTITASGSGFSFRYPWMYSDTSAAKNVILHWDYGSTISLASGDSANFVIAGTGILTIT